MASSSSRECVPPSRFFSIRSKIRAMSGKGRGDVDELVARERSRKHRFAPCKIDARGAAAQTNQQLVGDDAGRLGEFVERDLVVALRAENDDLVAWLDV